MSAIEIQKKKTCLNKCLALTLVPDEDFKPSILKFKVEQ